MRKRRVQYLAERNRTRRRSEYGSNLRNASACEFNEFISFGTVQCADDCQDGIEALKQIENLHFRL
jgi:hypothetical protein